MKIKAIIVDLDRTLLRSDKTISPYTAEVLKYCQSRGIKVLVATARPWRTMEAFLQVIPFDAQTVSNGARILCGEEKKEFPICIGDVERILKVLRVKDTLKVTLETGEVAYSNLPVEEYETILTEDLLDRAKEEGALKILVHLEDPVDSVCSHMGIGPKLINYLLQKAKENDIHSVFILTTQTSDWFEKLGFKISTVDTLPQERKEKWTKERGSKVLRINF